MKNLLIQVKSNKDPRYTEISVTNGEFTEFPDYFSRMLPLAKKLSINATTMQVLPNLGNLEHLEDLNLANNNLRALSDDIKAIKSLQSIDLSDNKFTEIPLIIAEMPQLKRLIIARNPLYSLFPFDSNKIAGTIPTSYLPIEIKPLVTQCNLNDAVSCKGVERFYDKSFGTIILKLFENKLTKKDHIRLCHEAKIHPEYVEFIKKEQQRLPDAIKKDVYRCLRIKEEKTNENR
jgi:hypothetical protein